MQTVLRKLAAPDATAALRRFPFAVLAAVMVGGRALLPDGLNVDWDDPATAWSFGWTVVFMSSVAIAVCSESLSLRNGVALQAASLLLGLAAGLAFETPWISPLWTLLALAALMLAAPSPGRDEQALWGFDARATALFLFAFIAAATVALGLIAILSAAEYLFDVEFGHRATSRILNVSFWILLPIYWCALVPARDAEPLSPDDLLFKASVTLGALLALVKLALALLLHLYAARIMLYAAMPKNQVGWIVSVALSVGLLAWVLSAGEGGPLAGLRRVFRRWWFLLTIVPTALLAFAIRERIASYGVTADRYAVAAAAVVSVAFLGLCLARMKPPTIRSVLLAGATVALIAAIGPVNMPGVVAASQIERLRSILAEKGLLQNGRVSAQIPKDSWSVENGNEIAGILSVLDGVSARSRLAPIVPADRIASHKDTMDYLGAEYRSVESPDNPWVMLPRKSGVIVMRDAGTLVGPFDLSRSPDGEPPFLGTSKTLVEGWTVALDAEKIFVRNGDAEIVFDLAPLVASASASASESDRTNRPLALTSIDGRAWLRIEYAQLNRRPDGLVVVTQFTGIVFISVR